MTRRALLAAVVLLAALAARAASAQAMDPTERARRAYAFATWPPAEGAPRDGIDLARVCAPGLVERSRRLEPLPGTPALTVGFGRERVEEVEVLVQVHVEAEAALAREALLVFLAGCQRPLERLAPGEGPGDLAFGLRAGEPARPALLAFARDNIAVTVRWVGAGAPEADIGAIAAAIDALALESPRASAERPLSVPAVVRFGAAGAPAAAQAAGVPLALETRGDVAARAFRAARGTIQDDPARGLVYVPAAPGPSRAEVFLLGARGLRARAEMEIDSPR